MKDFFRFLVAVLVTVVSFLLLNLVSGTCQNADAIWSGKGFLVIFAIAIIWVSLYVWANDLKFTFNLIGRFFIIMAIVYVFGILIGALVLKTCGYETTITPIWSGAGFVMCMWCAFVAKLGSCLMKLD